MEESEPRFSDVNSEVFHYTTLEGFRGIVESATFWATHYQDLNDASELQRYQGIVLREAVKVIDPLVLHQWPILANEIRLKNIATERIASDLIEVIHNATYGPLGLRDLFVVCFCKHDKSEDRYTHENGLLSQWRGYAQSDGVAIVLRSKILENLLDRTRKSFGHPALHIADVVYDHDTNVIEKNIGIHLRKLGTILSKMVEAGFSGSPAPPDEMEELLKLVLLTSTTIKHQAFHEEQEARIVCATTNDAPGSIFTPREGMPTAEVHFRQRNSGRARYIELFRREDVGHGLPIKRVIVGPGPQANVNKRQVEMILAKNRIEADVTVSDIPYVAL